MAKKSEEIKKEEKLPKIEELYKMKFTDDYGNVLMVRKAFGGIPRGRLEIYCPPEEQK